MVITIALKSIQWRRHSLVWMLLWMLPYAGISQQKDPCTQVKPVFDQLMRQLVDPTETGLRQLTHPRLSYGHSNGRIENQDEFVQALVLGKSDFKAIQSTAFQCEGTSGTVYIRQELAADIQDGGVDQSIRLHVLYIFTKEKKSWILLARQAVKRNPS